MSCTDLFCLPIFVSPLRLGCESGPHHSHVSWLFQESPSLPSWCKLCHSCCTHSAFSSKTCPLLPRKLHLVPLHTVVPAGLEHRNQDKVCCPRTALSTVEHIYEQDLNKRDVFQLLPNNRQRVCPASPSTSWDPDPNSSLLYHCQTLAELSFCLLPGLSATRAERRGEEEVEWVMSFKLERGDIFLVESVHTYPRRDWKMGKEQSPVYIDVQIAMGWPARSRSTVPWQEAGVGSSQITSASCFISKVLGEEICSEVKLVIAQARRRLGLQWVGSPWGLLC